MSMEDKVHRTGMDMPNHLILEDRRRLNVSGVMDVESFDETLVTMETSGGMLTVRGTGLHVERLSLDEGELVLEGEVASLEYEDRTSTRGGLLSRLFG